MKIPVFRLFFLLLLALAFSPASVYAQNPRVEKNEYAGEMPSLQGLTEAFTFNGQPALKILTRKSGGAEVRFEKRDGQDALVFMVTRLKGFGLGVLADGEGKLFVTREKVTFEPNADREHFFSVNRAEMKDIDVKKAGAGLDMVLFELKQDKKRFILTGTLALNRRDVKHAITFLYHTIINFDAALALFNEHTAGVRQKPDGDEEKEDLTVDTEATDKYDRFRDITVVSTSRLPIKGARRTIRAQVQYNFPGETQKTPDMVTLFLYVSGPNPVLTEDDLALNFLVDNDRVPLGDMKLAEEKAKSVVRQTLSIVIPYETFRRLAGGSKVEFQIGALEYTLTDQHLEALRNLLSYKSEN